MTTQEALKKYFGYNDFRPLQEDIIQHIINHKNCLVLMPTGGGKSICYQLPALMMEGTAVVVSPLISLMKDQVERLRANGIAAVAMNSSFSEIENQNIAIHAIRGEYKLLYISPEKLLSEMEYGFLRPSTESILKVNMFAIDEAHCISQWGHDFRPEYTQLGRLKEYFPNVPIAAFTATADKVTQEDIVQQLHISDSLTNEAKIFISSFDRPNLSLDIRRGYSAKDKLRYLLALINRHPHESGIIYCLSRKTTENIAGKLQGNGIRAKAYHAGLSSFQRNEVQEDFINDKIDVVCATIAFGMGIDKSNVRYVVHYNLPKSIESYYQEIGRGGRDGLPCETVLFYNISDVITLRKFAGESGQQYINEEKLKYVQKYAESQICRRRILLNYFGETMNHDCGNCDVCKNPPQRFDGTILVQKALSAIVRTRQQVSFRLLINILRGSNTQELLQYDFQKLKTYGCGNDISFNDWQDYLMQMLHLGYIEIDYKNKSHIKTTPQGEDVLYGRTRAKLAVITHEDFSTKDKKHKLRPEHFSASDEDENMRLFEKLKQLRRQLATERNVPPYIIFGDNTLHSLATLKPETRLAFSSIVGVGTHKQETFGTTFIKFIRSYKGLSIDETEEWNNLSDGTQKNITTSKSKVQKDFITFQGTKYYIDSSILYSIKWRQACEHVGKDMYYNLWENSCYPMTRYIPQDTDNRDAVVKRFSEIITAVYAITVSPDFQWVEIPLRIEYDMNGNPVHSLRCNSFEDGLKQLKQFIEQNGHFPFAGNSEYECSLRRWMHKITRGVMHLTDNQQTEYDNMMKAFEHIPKNRIGWEKSNKDALNMRTSQ